LVFELSEEWVGTRNWQLGWRFVSRRESRIVLRGLGYPAFCGGRALFMFTIRALTHVLFLLPGTYKVTGLVGYSNEIMMVTIVRVEIYTVFIYV
jgi:hypothetical protein